MACGAVPHWPVADASACETAASCHHRSGSVNPSRITVAHSVRGSAHRGARQPPQLLYGTVPNSTKHPGERETRSTLHRVLWVRGCDESPNLAESLAWLLHIDSRRTGVTPLIRLGLLVDRPVEISTWAAVSQACSDMSVSDVVIGMPANPAVLRALAAEGTRNGFRLHVAAGHTPIADGIEEPAGVPSVIHALTAPHRFKERPPASESVSSLRRAIDVMAAIALCIMLIPLVMVAAVAIIVDSKGSPIFAQIRVGERGRAFTMWKLRTMQRQAASSARSPSDGDPGVTRVGRLLRSTGIDEIPQLLNVLRGEMTLVGPRPEMPFIVDDYTPFQRERLSARPGITGLWQLRGGRFAAMHEQMEFDVYYIAFRSLALDVRLMADTVLFPLRGAARAFRRGTAEPHDRVTDAS